MGPVNTGPKPPVREDHRLRGNSVSLFAHGVAEYGIGGLTILAPFLFSFDSDVARLVSLLMGAGIIVLAFVAEAPTGVARNMPIASHVVLDYVASIVMLISPFVFGFKDDAAATAYFIVIGIGYLLLTISTRYRPG
jgi:hypothetical protein